jgi:hypothetical protein
MEPDERATSSELMSIYWGFCHRLLKKMIDGRTRRFLQCACKKYPIDSSNIVYYTEKQKCMDCTSVLGLRGNCQYCLLSRANQVMLSQERDIFIEKETPDGVSFSCLPFEQMSLVGWTG